MKNYRYKFLLVNIEVTQQFHINSKKIIKTVRDALPSLCDFPWRKVEFSYILVNRCFFFFCCFVNQTFEKRIPRDTSRFHVTYILHLFNALFRDSFPPTLKTISKNFMNKKLSEIYSALHQKLTPK